MWDIYGFELPIQVIELGPNIDPAERVKELDFDFCQVWHDGRSIHFTEGFTEAVRFRQVTLSRCEDEKQFERSMRRWDRLKQKYPDFTLVIPEEYRAFQGAGATDVPLEGAVL